jgi:hypothetical protein
MLVVMVAIGGVPMAVVSEVDVVVVRDRLVPAVGSVHVGVASMSQVGQRMLVVMSVMRSMGMTFMHVVGVPLALGACMPAAGAVDVVMLVNRVLGGRHGSSLL